MPRHDASEQEAAALVKGSPEADGPQVITGRATAIHDAIVPPHTPELDYLAGRVALTLEETQLALGIGEQALKTAIRKGEIPSLKVANRRLVPLKALERHLEALAYAESGALDAWEAALIRAATGRLKRTRRQAWERRKELRRKLREARRRADEVVDNPDTPKDVALEVATELTSLRAELSTEQSLAERVGHDLTKDIDKLVRHFDLTEEGLEGPRLGLGPKEPE